MLTTSHDTSDSEQGSYVRSDHRNYIGHGLIALYMYPLRECLVDQKRDSRP